MFTKISENLRPAISLNQSTMAETQVAHGKDIPDAKAIEAIDKLTVYDGDNKAIPFPDLYKDTDKTLFVFVRHFYCGRCQE